MPATKAQAQRVLAALERQNAGFIGALDFNPTLRKSEESGEWEIIWEEGPYLWVHTFPRGGVVEGSRTADVEFLIPSGVWTEPQTETKITIWKDPS